LNHSGPFFPVGLLESGDLSSRFLQTLHKTIRGDLFGLPYRYKMRGNQFTNLPEHDMLSSRDQFGISHLLFGEADCGLPISHYKVLFSNCGMLVT